MILQHVADRTGAVVVIAASFHADGLGDGDLHLLDVPRVPQRLEQGVAEAQGEQVLHAVLAQIVIDAIDAILVEARGDAVVDRDGLGKIVADRLLQHHPRAGTGESVRGERSAGPHIERGRSGEVVEHVARAQRGHARSQRSHRRIVVERGGLVMHAIEQRGDGGIVQKTTLARSAPAHRRPQNGSRHRRAKTAQCRGCAGRLGQQAIAMQAVQRRQQHALRQVTGGAEDRQQGRGGGNGEWAHVSAAAVGCDPAPTSRVGYRR